MKNPLKKILIVFVLIALLPVSFIIYELSALSKNEEIIKGIYQNQLDAILYSVNQYSDDVISSWANKVSNTNVGTQELDNDSLKNLQTVLSQFNAVRYIYIGDGKKSSRIYGVNADAKSESVRALVDKLLKKDSVRVSKLSRYAEAGFRKMDPIDTLIDGRLVPVLFVISQDSSAVIGAMILDLPLFIQTILGPKMQAIAQDKFVISAFQSDNDSLVYSTGLLTQEARGALTTIKQDLKIKTQKKEFWILPGHYLGISLQGATIDDLVKDRMIISISILALLVFILSAGIFFLYRNIKREIDLSQAKSEFVSNISHEIRTPLSLISMYAETLEMNRVNEDRKKEYYAIIAKETTRLTRIVNRILNFSQIEANKKRYNFEPIQLNDLCGEIIASYLYPLKEKGFVCDLIQDFNLPPVEGDRESISEAIMNLVDNAIKYSKDQKHITVTTSINQKYCCLAVKDEGIGISASHQQEVFNQFYRVPSGDVHNTKGSGLGLTLVKKTMEAHHGKIKVESQPGKGSTFTLYFPFKNPVKS